MAIEACTIINGLASLYPSCVVNIINGEFLNPVDFERNQLIGHRFVKITCAELIPFNGRLLSTIPHLLYLESLFEMY